MVITNIVYYFFMVKLIFKEIPFMFSLMIKLTEFLLNYKKKVFFKNQYRYSGTKYEFCCTHHLFDLVSGLMGNLGNMQNMLKNMPPGAIENAMKSLTPEKINEALENPQMQKMMESMG